MKLELNHPYINLPSPQQVLVIKLINSELDFTGEATNTGFNFTRFINHDVPYFKITNNVDNVIDFYKFSPNCKIPIYKFKDYTISGINNIDIFDDALSPEVTIYTLS